MYVTCHSRFMYQNIYIFSTDIPVLKAKRLLRQLRLFSWPTMVLIAFPSQVWVFNHVQPLSRNDFVISLPVLKYWRRCPPVVPLWRLTRQRWRRPLSWNQNKNQNVALIISFESWFDNADFRQNEKNYLELKYVSQFCFPLCFFLGPSKSLMISKNQTKFLEASKMFRYIMIATLFYLYEFHIVIDKEHRYYRFRSRFSRQMKDSNIIARMKVLSQMCANHWTTSASRDWRFFSLSQPIDVILILKYMSYFCNVFVLKMR